VGLKAKSLCPAALVIRALRLLHVQLQPKAHLNSMLMAALRRSDAKAASATSHALQKYPVSACCTNGSLVQRCHNQFNHFPCMLSLCKYSLKCTPELGSLMLKGCSAHLSSDWLLKPCNTKPAKNTVLFVAVSCKHALCHVIYATARLRFSLCRFKARVGANWRRG